ncbi:MAG TPA: hypothetical protein VFP78_08975 [Solirubrobacteraceae bacterium]|nr:hypothetical protein [Solirubrobacteraceae bacterium]
MFRIDHFLGKEGIQNLLALRFANGMFEPAWNRNHIDHIQIDVPETLSVDGRVSFYDATGAFRDMVVTHLFQLLGFLAMEPPTSMHARALLDAKRAVFESLRPLDPQEVVRGQYAGYRTHADVAAGSDTETLVALTAHIDNARWDGVPIFIRTGKRMGADRKLITIAFHEPPRSLFPFADADARRSRQNRLTFDFDERGGITIGFLAKRPGPVIELEPATMRFGYESLGTGLLEAYERLFHDAMIGDKTLFNARRRDQTAVGGRGAAPRVAAPGGAVSAGRMGPRAGHPQPHRAPSLGASITLRRGWVQRAVQLPSIRGSDAPRSSDAGNPCARSRRRAIGHSSSTSAQIGRKRPQFASTRLPVATAASREFAGLSRPLERFRPTTDDRGVPGSSRSRPVAWCRSGSDGTWFRPPWR